MKIEKAMVILNPWSGMRRGMKCYKELIKWKEEKAEESGIKLDVFFTERSGDNTCAELAKKAIREKYDAIVIIGGDGTVNEVANGLSGSDIPVVVVQAGHGNDFARAIGSPAKIREALDLLIYGEKKAVDLITVNGRICINIFGIGGIDTKVVECVEKILKKRWFFLPKKALYLVALIRELAQIRYPYLKLEVSELGKPVRLMEGEVSLFAVTNGSTCGGIFRLNPGADLSDGLLEVCWIKKTNRFRILVNIIRAFKGTHLCLPEVVTLPDGTLPRLVSFTVSSREPLIAEMDGEIIPADKEFKIAVIPQALKVLVPPSIIAAQIPLAARRVRASKLQLA